MTEHIQINDTSPRIQYTANGVQAAFTYPFAIFANDDLEVSFGAVQQTTGFSITGAGSSTGGTVTFDTAPPNATLITLRRVLGLERTSDFQADGIIRAKTLNDELDYQVAAIQQVSEQVSRAIVRPATSASTASLTLPDPVAGKAIGWNSDATGLTNDPADFATTVTTVTTQAGIATSKAAEAIDSAAAAASSKSGADAAKALADAAAAAALGYRDDAAALVEAAGLGDMQSVNNLSELTNPAAARTNLELGSAAVAEASAFLPASTTPNDIGAQPAHAKLSALSSLTGGADKLPYFSGADAMGQTDLTGFARTLLGSADAAAAKAALAVGAGALEFVSSATASNSASVDFTALEAGYDYIIAADNVAPASESDSVTFRLRFGTGAGPTWQSTNYGSSAISIYWSGPSWYPSSGATDGIELTGGSIGLGCSLEITLHNPGATAEYKRALAIGKGLRYAVATQHNTILGGGEWQSNTAVTAVRLYFPGTNIGTGTFSLWRRKRSA